MAARLLRLVFAVVIGLTVSTTAVAQNRRPPAIVQTPPPVVMQPVPPERLGDWSVRRFGDGYLAAVTNESESGFGIFCGKDCAIVFNPRLQCESKVSIPALANTPAGAIALNFKCGHFGELRWLVAQLDTVMLDAFEIGGQIGIAVPMEAGTFKVVRFSLTGALAAAKRAYRLSHPAEAQDPGRGLRDQTL